MYIRCMDIKKIFQNNQEWINKNLSIDPNYFEKLSEGQKPEVLFIGCSDSRVTAEELMGLHPGEVFVHRNISNMVISIDLNMNSVVDYAVNYLKVKHIVICGHYFCGGVKAAMQAQDMGILNPWLRNIRDVYRIHKEELSRIKCENERYNRLVELNVQEQCINLIKIASVQKAYNKRNLQVYGWVFDIHSGKLIDLEIDLPKELEEIMQIYNLGDVQ